jgi:hypothetical protein
MGADRGACTIDIFLNHFVLFISLIGEAISLLRQCRFDFSTSRLSRKVPTWEAIARFLDQ